MSTNEDDTAPVNSSADEKCSRDACDENTSEKGSDHKLDYLIRYDHLIRLYVQLFKKGEEQHLGLRAVRPKRQSSHSVVNHGVALVLGVCDGADGVAVRAHQQHCIVEPHGHQILQDHTMPKINLRYFR